MARRSVRGVVRLIHAKSAAVALALAPLLVLAACSGDRGESTDDTTTTAPGPEITVASFEFGESEILAAIYGAALEGAGVRVNYRLKLGPREVVAPALEKGEVDLVPEYVGNLLVFYDAAARSPGDDLPTATEKLRERARDKNLVVLQPSAATNGDVIAMTRAKATSLGVTKISDLRGKESRLVFGGPPECAQRLTCLKGLQDVYGLRFADFKPLDSGGPVTVASLRDGDVDVARLFSSDPSIGANDFVVLEDDRSIQPQGNVVPVVRDDVLDAEIEAVLDKVSASLTTDDLISFRTKVDLQQEDPATVAGEWLAAHPL
jgi:osmoprotectant transport system substrate-binding protein